MAELYQILQLGPVDRFAVEPQAKPPAVAHLRRHIKARGLAGSAIRAFALTGRKLGAGPRLSSEFRLRHYGFFVGLTYSTRRKRSADQSSSIATIRTDSNPAPTMTFQPESRLNSQV